MREKVKDGWRMVKLGEVAEEVRETYEPTPNEDLKYIGLEHIEQQTLRLNAIGSSSATQSTKKVFKANDILFGSLRAYFRKVIKPKFFGVCSTDITVIRSKPDYYQDFLFYFIANQDFIDFATNWSSGTRMPRANWNVLSKSEWLVPPYDTQRKIASILSAYDDLIENNTRRIKILEEMARAIYKEWFVNFRFPGHEKVKMVEIPVETCHGVSLQKQNSNTNQFSEPVSGSLSTIINQYKSTVTRWCRKDGYDNFAWQSRFYDHIIRNEKSLQKIREYIMNNPVKWELDEYNPNKLKNR